MFRTIRPTGLLLAVLLASTSGLALAAEKTAEKTAEKPAAEAGAVAKEAEKKPESAQPAASEKPPAEIAKLGEFKYEPKDSDIVYGSKDAPLTMVEYASFSCSHCSAFYRDVFPEIQKNYIDTGKLKMVFRSFPLNQPALDAAKMVSCADNSLRPTYVKVLFNTQDKWAYDVSFRESLAGIAVLGGMERKKFDECLASKEVENSVLLTYQEAQAQFKVTSTPTLFLGNEIVKGDHSFDTVRRALDKALAALPKK